MRFISILKWKEKKCKPTLNKKWPTSEYLPIAALLVLASDGSELSTSIGCSLALTASKLYVSLCLSSANQSRIASVFKAVASALSA